MRSVCAATYGTNQFIESWRAITRRLTQWCFSLHRIFPVQKKKYRSDVQTRSRCSIDRNRIIYLNLWLSIYLHWYEKQCQTISIEKVEQSLELCYGVKNSDSACQFTIVFTFNRCDYASKINLPIKIISKNQELSKCLLPLVLNLKCHSITRSLFVISMGIKVTVQIL